MGQLTSTNNLLAVRAKALVGKLLAIRTKTRRWVYIVVLCNVLFLALVPALEPLGKIPLFVFPVTCLFVIQFIWPTLFLWSVLLGTLLIREIDWLLVVRFHGVHDYVAWFWYVVWDVVPIALLLWARPRVSKSGKD
jgi:hypothetical protein